MKFLLKLIGGLLALFLVVIAAALIYLKTALPNVGPALDLKVEATPERIERGRYLAHHVAVCIDCHSTRDWGVFSGPLVDGTWGKGGEVFDERFGFPGAFYAKNITPAGVGQWTDGELYRAITAGVSKDGHALFPIMPYPNYGQMPDEEIYAIIAYIRTLTPIQNDVPPAKPSFPMNFIMNTIPKKGTPGIIPDKTNPVQYGKYITTSAGCADCHTRQDHGKPVPGMDFAGGFAFPLGGGGVVRSTNITPDMETGIGKWSKEDFIRRFKAYSDSGYVAEKVEPRAFNTIMPWIMYTGMTEEDLGAIYEYLRTVPVVSNNVAKFTAN